MAIELPTAGTNSRFRIDLNSGVTGFHSGIGTCGYTISGKPGTVSARMSSWGIGSWPTGQISWAYANETWLEWAGPTFVEGPVNYCGVGYGSGSTLTTSCIPRRQNASVPQFTANTWSTCAVGTDPYNTGTLRVATSLYIAGGAINGPNVSSGQSTTNADSLAIGSDSYNGTMNQNFQGDLFHFAYWDAKTTTGGLIALSNRDLVALAKGVSPSLVRRSLCISFIPMYKPSGTYSYFGAIRDLRKRRTSGQVTGIGFPGQTYNNRNPRCYGY